MTEEDQGSFRASAAAEQPKRTLIFVVPRLDLETLTVRQKTVRIVGPSKGKA